MGSPVIFNGNYAKTLTKNIKLGGDVLANDIDIAKDTFDPNVTALSANAGSLYFQAATQKLFQKRVTGSNTKWKNLDEPRDIIGQINADWSGTDEWATGNNAIFDGGGVFNGTFTRSVIAADIIDGVATWKWVGDALAGNNTNNYIAYQTINIPQGFRGQTIGLSIGGYRWSGTSNNMVVKVKDTTNTAILVVTNDQMAQYVDGVDFTSSRHDVYFTCPTDCTQVEIGFQIITGEANTVFSCDDIFLYRNPDTAGVGPTYTDWSVATLNIQTVNYLLLAADRGKAVYMNNAAARTFTLPDIVGDEIYILKNIGAGTVTITPDGSDTTELALLEQTESVILQGDGTNNLWRVLSAYLPVSGGGGGAVAILKVVDYPDLAGVGGYILGNSVIAGIAGTTIVASTAAIIKRVEIHIKPNDEAIALPADIDLQYSMWHTSTSDPGLAGANHICTFGFYRNSTANGVSTSNNVFSYDVGEIPAGTIIELRNPTSVGALSVDISIRFMGDQ